MVGLFYPPLIGANWALPLSINGSLSVVTTREDTLLGLEQRLAQRIDLIAEEKQAAQHIGVTLLEADFCKFKSLVLSFSQRPKELHRFANVLVSELQCSEVTVLTSVLICWKAPGQVSGRDICIVSVRMERLRRVISLATDATFGVHVLAPGTAVASGKLVLVNEDAHLLFNKMGSMATQGPPPLTGGPMH